MSKFRPEITFAGIPLGFEVRKSIGHLITWRKRPRIQDKYYYFIPANPRSPKQQAWRTRFKWTVQLAKRRYKGTVELQERTVPRIGACDWFLSAMRWLMSATNEFVPVLPHQTVLSFFNSGDWPFTRIELADYVSPTAFAVLVMADFADTGSSAKYTRLALRDGGTGLWQAVHGIHIDNVSNFAHFILGLDSQKRIGYIIYASGDATAWGHVYLIGYFQPAGP